MGSSAPPPFMHMFVQFEMAFRYCYGSRFVYALLVVRAVISNGNYTRHFRRNWDLFRSLGTLRGVVTLEGLFTARHESHAVQRSTKNEQEVAWLLRLARADATPSRRSFRCHDHQLL